jgi:hypothetical protein
MVEEWGDRIRITGGDPAAYAESCARFSESIRETMERRFFDNMNPPRREPRSWWAEWRDRFYYAWQALKGDYNEYG